MVERRRNRVVEFFTSTSIITADPSNETQTFRSVRKTPRDECLKNATTRLPCSFRGFFFLFMVETKRKKVQAERTRNFCPACVYTPSKVNFEYYSAQSGFPRETFIFGISIRGICFFRVGCVRVYACALERKQTIFSA